MDEAVGGAGVRGGEGAMPVQAGYRAVQTVYHAYVTGVILAAVLRRGRPDAAELVFRVFRRQHRERFLPGLVKLGLDGLPHAVACAQYHYLSNQLGGVRVEYMYESDRKAWVRYVPPRWIYPGATICGVPSEVSRAMLRGWHAHNGVSLGNARLGFVCTGQTTDGQPGLEGYYLEHERDLAPEERLRFAPGEEAPDFDPARAPRVDGPDWPADRLAKVARNYCMDYVRTILAELPATFGPAEARALGHAAAVQVGMQHYTETAALLGVRGDAPEDFAAYLVAMADAQGDAAAWTARDGEVVVEQSTWRLVRGLGGVHPAAFDAWTGLWEGALAVHNRRLALTVARRLDLGDDRFEWRVRRRGPARLG